MLAKKIRQLIITSCLLLLALTANAEITYEPTTKNGGEKISSEKILEFRPIQTDSPRQTIETFIYIANELEKIALQGNLDIASDTPEIYDRTLFLIEQGIALVDLSLLPERSIREVGSSTIAYLLDIFNRVEFPKVETIPDSHDADAPLSWRIPNTPIRIVRITEGTRIDEYLFSASTPDEAKRFYLGLSELPDSHTSALENWTETLPQITGPAIPAEVVHVIPDALKLLWLDTPIWKILIILSLFTIFSILIITLYLACSPNNTSSWLAVQTRHSLIPLSILLLVLWGEPFISYELNLFGAFWIIVTKTLLAIKYSTAAWLFWSISQAISKGIAHFNQDPETKLNIPLILITGRALTIFIIISILASGAHALGLPIYSVIAGLGVGGIAVALSVRPTLENLFGGLILYLDRPVRVGDHCSFGENRGTVEEIGVRTVKIRGLDRTLITVPNAEFANMELTNWAECDMMLISTTIFLRHEMNSDQVRHLLVKLREMLHAHPKIDTETVRVRLIDFGQSSIEVNMRVYALTHEWNEFFAIREDVLLRIKDLVTDSGANFALPAQALYLTRDQGIDEKLRNEAINEVMEWRQSGRLPFPRLSEKRMCDLKGTLDWPPHGSVGNMTFNEENAEPLSTEPTEEDEPKSETCPPPDHSS